MNQSHSDMITEVFPKRYKPLPETWRVIAHLDENANEIMGWTATNFVLNYESEPFYDKYAARRFIFDNHAWIEGNVSSLNEKS